MYCAHSFPLPPRLDFESFLMVFKLLISKIYILLTSYLPFSGNLLFLSFFFFFFCGTELELRAYTEPLHQHFFMMGFFQDRVSHTIFPDWLETAILLISAS
jgi:hypothetical protein